MSEASHRRHRIQIALPIRVRGMSSEQKFFDETTETALVSDHEVMTRLSQPVELEAEVHLTSLKTEEAGIYRVIWVNRKARDGRHDVGLELVESEASLWRMEFPPAAGPGEETIARASLVCAQCGGKELSAVPEAEEEFLSDGFVIARPCETCKSTTEWLYAPETPAAEAPTAGAGREGPELRGKGRAPMRVHIKIIRKLYGSSLEEVCETENVSRTGAYFYSSIAYQPGDRVEVILPYRDGDVAIPVPARVVRAAPVKRGSPHGVAIHLEKSEH